MREKEKSAREKKRGRGNREEELAEGNSAKVIYQQMEKNHTSKYEETEKKSVNITDQEKNESSVWRKSSLEPPIICGCWSLKKKRSVLVQIEIAEMEVNEGNMGVEKNS